MTESLPPLTGALTARQLRQDRSLAPGGPRFQEVAGRFSPLVHGVASATLPEKPEAVEGICAAVLETLAFRWKSISRKTPLATWLTRTTYMAAMRERARQGLPRKASTPNGIVAQALFKGIDSLSAPYADAAVVQGMLRETLLDVKQPRAEKRCAKALQKLDKRVQKVARKSEVTVDTRALLQSIPSAPAPEIEGAILARVSQWNRKIPKAPLVASTISAWRWIALGRFIKGVAKGVATVICILVALGFTLGFLVKRGHVNPTMLFIGGMQKGLLKEFPEMGAPAKPWPVTEEDKRHASLRAPETSAALYGLTNIWVAKIRIEPEHWQALQPKYIPPAEQNGRLALRNPNASRSGLAGSLGIDFHWTEGSFQFADKTFERVGVRIRGNGTYLNSLFGPKQSYKVDLNRFKKGENIGGVNTLNFVNAIPDYSYVKDALAEKLFRELGVVAPRTAYAYLTIDSPGNLTNKALGLYAMIENIDGDFAKDRFGTKDVPIFKPVDYELFKDLGSNYSAYAEIYDLKTKAAPEQLGRVVEMAKLVSHASDEEFAAKIGDLLDLEEYAGFVAGHVLISSYDGYLSNGQNFYMYLDPRSNKFGFISWDQDHAWGEFQYVSTAEKRENASIWNPASYDNRFLKRVMKVEAFKAVYRKKLEQALAGPFTVEKLYREVDALAAAIRPAVAAENDFRLQRFEIAISTNFVSGPRDGRMNDGSAEGPRAPSHQIKRFIQARVKSVRDQLDGKSEGMLISGFGEQP